MEKYIRPNCTFRRVLDVMKKGEGVDTKKLLEMFPNSRSSLSMVIWHIKNRLPDEYDKIYFRDENGQRTYHYSQPSQPEPEQANKSALDRIADALEKLVNACVVDANIPASELLSQERPQVAIRLYAITNKTTKE